VLTIGTFDLLHFGHVDFLRAAARLGAVLTVGVNSDDFAGSFKRRPVMSQDERMHAVGQLGYEVLLNTSAGRELIEAHDAHEPDVLAVGSDWARKDYLRQIGVTQDWLDARRITLAYVPYVQHAPISTSEIIRRIRSRVE
jgi:cytidyltransferase-like protein